MLSVTADPSVGSYVIHSSLGQSSSEVPSELRSFGVNEGDVEVTSEDPNSPHEETADEVFSGLGSECLVEQCLAEEDVQRTLGTDVVMALDGSESILEAVNRDESTEADRQARPSDEAGDESAESDGLQIQFGDGQLAVAGIAAPESASNVASKSLHVRPAIEIHESHRSTIDHPSGAGHPDGQRPADVNDVSPGAESYSITSPAGRYILSRCVLVAQCLPSLSQTGPEHNECGEQGIDLLARDAQLSTTQVTVPRRSTPAVLPSYRRDDNGREMAFAEVVSRLDEPTVLRVAYGSSVPSENRVSMARAAARRVKRIQMAQQSEQNGEDFQDSAEAVNPLTTDSTFAPDDFLPTLPEADQAQLVETLTRPAAADAGKTDSLIGLEEDLQFDSSVPREVFPRGPPAVEETPIHIGGAESNDFADNDSANGFEQHPTSSAPIAREAINKADVLPLLETSIQQWRQLPSLADRTSHLDQVTFTIVDLPGEQLAETNGSHILIDATAANSGWYLDSTPFDHSEFDATSAALSATAASSATGQIDLLTVLNHELGHVIGLVHAEPVHGSDDLMVDHLAEANDGS